MLHLDVDLQTEINQSLQFGKVPVNLCDCPICAKNGLVKCRCPGKKGNSGNNGASETDGKRNIDDPFNLLKHKTHIPFSPLKIPEMRLSLENTQGKKLTEEEEKAAHHTLTKMKTLFETLIKGLSDSGLILSHLLKHYYFHINHSSQIAIVNIPDADHHDAFIQLLRREKLLAEVGLEKDKAHEKHFTIRPFSTRPRNLLGG